MKVIKRNSRIELEKAVEENLVGIGYEFWVAVS